MFGLLLLLVASVPTRTGLSSIDLAGSTVSFIGVPLKAQVAVKAVLIDEVNKRCRFENLKKAEPKQLQLVSNATVVQVLQDTTLGYEAFQIQTAGRNVQVSASSVRGFVLAAGTLYSI